MLYFVWCWLLILQDELLYADQKVVIKCHDMARWQDSGIQWNSGMIPLYESDFVCINDKYYLDSHYVDKERERQLKASESWKSGDQPRSLHILTFPAYCRYRALKKRLLAGACLAKAQLVALGGVLGNQTSQRVLFCRDSFHHPLLDKFELAGDNKGMYFICMYECVALYLFTDIVKLNIKGKVKW